MPYIIIKRVTASCFKQIPVKPRKLQTNTVNIHHSNLSDNKQHHWLLSKLHQTNVVCTKMYNASTRQLKTVCQMQVILYQTKRWWGNLYVITEIQNYLLPDGSLGPTYHDPYGSQSTGNGCHHWYFYSLEILRCVPRMQIVIRRWVPFEF